MARTALQLTAEQLASYRPARLEADAGLGERVQRAWEAARAAAVLLRERFGATRVVLFGSLVHPAWFTPWSDIDVAAWGVPADQFFRAVGALSGLSGEFKIDLIDPQICRPALREEIDREGREL